MPSLLLISSFNLFLLASAFAASTPNPKPQDDPKYLAILNEYHQARPVDPLDGVGFNWLKGSCWIDEGREAMWTLAMIRLPNDNGFYSLRLMTYRQDITLPLSQYDEDWIGRKLVFTAEDQLDGSGFPQLHIPSQVRESPTDFYIHFAPKNKNKFACKYSKKNVIIQTGIGYWFLPLNDFAASLRKSGTTRIKFALRNAQFWTHHGDIQVGMEVEGDTTGNFELEKGNPHALRSLQGGRILEDTLSVKVKAKNSGGTLVLKFFDRGVEVLRTRHVF